MSENVAEEGVVDKFIGEHHHDDRIDVETEISSRESFVLLVLKPQFQEQTLRLHIIL